MLFLFKRSPFFWKGDTSARPSSVHHWASWEFKHRSYKLPVLVFAMTHSLFVFTPFFPFFLILLSLSLSLTVEFSEKSGRFNLIWKCYNDRPWLVWLSGLSASLPTKGSLVWSQWGHKLGLQTRSPVGGAWEATTCWCSSPCLSLSLPLSKSINPLKNK